MARAWRPHGGAADAWRARCLITAARLLAARTGGIMMARDLCPDCCQMPWPPRARYRDGPRLCLIDAACALPLRCPLGGFHIGKSWNLDIDLLPELQNSPKI